MKRFLKLSGVSILVTIVGILTFVGYILMLKDCEKTMIENSKRSRAKEDKAFKAWVEHTANPKKLTKEEWQALRDAGIL